MPETCSLVNSPPGSTVWSASCALPIRSANAAFALSVISPCQAQCRAVSPSLSKAGSAIETPSASARPAASAWNTLRQSFHSFLQVDRSVSPSVSCHLSGMSPRATPPTSGESPAALAAAKVRRGEKPWCLTTISFRSTLVDVSIQESLEGFAIGFLREAISLPCLLKSPTRELRFDSR